MDEYDLVKNCFHKMGYKILNKKHKNANGPDMTIHDGTTAFTVEIKKVRFTKRKIAQVNFVEKNRTKDDFIAAVFPSGYVFIEPMIDHLSKCSKKGYRHYTLLK